MGDAPSEKSACGREALKAHGASRTGHLHATAERGGFGRTRRGSAALDLGLVEGAQDRLPDLVPIRRRFIRSHGFNPEGQYLAFAEAGRMQFEDGFHRGLPLLPPDLSEDPDSEPAAGAAGKGAKRLARPLRAGTAAGRSHLLIFLAPFSSEAFSPLGPRIEPRKRGPKSSCQAPAMMRTVKRCPPSSIRTRLLGSEASIASIAASATGSGVPPSSFS